MLERQEIVKVALHCNLVNSVCSFLGVEICD